MSKISERRMMYAKVLTELFFAVVRQVVFCTNVVQVLQV